MMWADALLLARLNYLSKFFDLIFIHFDYFHESTDRSLLFEFLIIVGVLNLFEFRLLNSTIVKNSLLNLFLPFQCLLCPIVDLSLQQYYALTSYRRFLDALLFWHWKIIQIIAYFSLIRRDKQRRLIIILIFNCLIVFVESLFCGCSFLLIQFYLNCSILAPFCSSFFQIFFILVFVFQKLACTCLLSPTRCKSFDIIIANFLHGLGASRCLLLNFCVSIRKITRLFLFIFVCLSFD